MSPAARRRRRPARRASNWPARYASISRTGRSPRAAWPRRSSMPPRRYHRCSGRVRSGLRSSVPSCPTSSTSTATARKPSPRRRRPLRSTPDVREYLLVFFVGASVTYLTTGLAGRFAHWVGAVLPARDRDVHDEKVPRLGGLAMLCGLMAAMLVASYLPRMREVFVESSDARALITAAAVMCLVGAADDIWDLSPLAKFAGQLLSAGLLVTGGVQLLYLPVPGGFFALSPVQGQLLSIIIVVGAANAVNFVDGLDGLAAGIVGIGAAAFFFYAYVYAVVQGDSRLTTPALVAVVLMSMCAGSCRTTCIPREYSWVTPAPCRWGCCWPQPRSPSPGGSVPRTPTGRVSCSRCYRCCFRWRCC